MDVDEFPTSTAKRQRTDSPDETRTQPISADPQSNDCDASVAANLVPESGSLEGATEKERSGDVRAQDTNALLDALMTQVEAESSPAREPASSIAPALGTLPPNETPRQDGKSDVASEGHVVQENTVAGTAITLQSGQERDATPTPTLGLNRESQLKATPHDDSSSQNVGPNRQSDPSAPTEGKDCMQGVEMGEIPALRDNLQNSDNGVGSVSLPSQQPIEPLQTDSAPGDVGAVPSEQPLMPEANAEGAEWEVDSSPYESSDSDSSDDTTSSEEDEDEDADGDYAMLDPEEAARILMQGDGGSDDEGDKSRDKSGGQVLRTANEKFEELIPKPDVVITEDMKIEELGNVEFVVENTVVIKAKTSGEYQVLEPGSLVCLNNRTVLGVVADLIGRVEEPRYTIRFPNNDEIEQIGLSAIGTTVFYVPQHSTFVFTQPLKGVKGSDASNFHDEEVAEDEMEFSDDEAEAEHKRQMKARKQNRFGDRGSSRAGRGHGRGMRRVAGPSHVATDNTPYAEGSVEMNYDDVSAGGDDDYTPLQRPSNLTEMMANGTTSREGNLSHALPPIPPTGNGQSDYVSRGDYGGRGRGRGRGRGYNNNPRGRGGFNSNNSSGGSGYQQQGYNQNLRQQTHGHKTYQQTPMGPPPALNFPTTPSISPHNITYPPMTPSPISPLPHAPFNFNFGASGSQPPSGFPFMPQQMAPGFFSGFNQQQNYAQPQNQYQNQNFAGDPMTNTSLLAALQRQAEEQRRNAGQGQ